MKNYLTIFIVTSVVALSAQASDFSDCAKNALSQTHSSDKAELSKLCIEKLETDFLNCGSVALLQVHGSDQEELSLICVYKYSKTVDLNQCYELANMQSSAWNRSDVMKACLQ